MSAPGEHVILRVAGGRIHRGFRFRRGRIATFEACNLDSATDCEVLDAIPESAESRDLCERCWPPRPGDIDPEPEAA